MVIILGWVHARERWYWTGGCAQSDAREDPLTVPQSGLRDGVSLFVYATGVPAHRPLPVTLHTFLTAQLWIQWICLVVFWRILVVVKGFYITDWRLLQVNSSDVITWDCIQRNSRYCEFNFIGFVSLPIPCHRIPQWICIPYTYLQCHVTGKYSTIVVNKLESEYGYDCTVTISMCNVISNYLWWSDSNHKQSDSSRILNHYETKVVIN